MYYYGYIIEMMIGSVTAVSLLWGIAAYVLRALSLQTIAKRRGLSKPWLAWIPVASDWLLGSISDQFQYLTQNKVQSRRKILLGLSIAGTACTLVTQVMAAVLIWRCFSYANVYYSDALLMQQATGLIGVILVALVTAAVGITHYVFQCMCRYDLYRSCEPKNATAYLVLGILFGVTEPFFLLACRNKDLGMPPRKPENEFL